MNQFMKCRKKPVEVEYREVSGEKEEIHTREGVLYAYAEQDYIIRGVQGELYPIKKDIFEKTYEVDDVTLRGTIFSFFKLWIVMFVASNYYNLGVFLFDGKYILIEVFLLATIFFVLAVLIAVMVVGTQQYLARRRERDESEVVP